MSIPEHAGKVATSTVEALKTNPSCLAAVLLSAFFAVLTFLAFQLNEARWHARAEQTSTLLAACFPRLQPHDEGRR
jgi:hypothetical protein